MRLIHILAGLVALVAGAVALSSAKGSRLHRGSGMVFAVAMLVMTSSAVVIAGFLRPDTVNTIAGVLTFYLVSTGLLTVIRNVEQSRRLLSGFMLVGLAASAYAFSLAFQALSSVNGTVNGIPPQPLFMFGIVGLLGGLLDARLLWAGGIAGAHRLARHLWRMGFAMFIATVSFFLGQPKVFPEFLRQNIGLRVIPVVLVILVLVYWLGRVFLTRRRAIT